MSDDDSLGSAGDDDVQVAAQISSMLKPLTKKQSKMGHGRASRVRADAAAGAALAAGAAAVARALVCGLTRKL